MDEYRENIKAKSLLAMLAKFDFIDYELLNELIGDDDEYTELIQKFLSESICNEMGANKENIKLNRAIRDTIRRGDWKISNELNIRITEHISSFVNTYKSEEKSLSDYFYSVQELLISNPDKLDLSTIIPSHILKTIATLYDVKKKWKSVIAIAYDALYENFNNLDRQLEYQIRQYLCLAYIRDKNDKFLAEVQKVPGASHEFLLGFYYRTIGRYSEASERLQKALASSPNLSGAKRELVQVFLSTHDYESALGLAKEHYRQNKQNPYAFQAYTTCLIKTYNKYPEREEEVETLLNTFELYKKDSTFANEVYDIQYAKFIANKGSKQALNLINDAIYAYSDSIYPIIAKFDIAERLNDIDAMKLALSALNNVRDKLPNKTIINVSEAILLAKQHRFDAAKLKIEQLRNYPEKSKKLLFEKLGLNDR